MIVRNDAGHNTFNSSEIFGNLAGAIVSDAYYPRPERTWEKTRQKWALQLGIDGFFNVAKEFWPDIDRHVFHGRYGSSGPGWPALDSLKRSFLQFRCKLRLISPADRCDLPKGIVWGLLLKL